MLDSSEAEGGLLEIEATDRLGGGNVHYQKRNRFSLTQLSSVYIDHALHQLFGILSNS